ncbi:regulatory protein [Salmonella enterica subsp. arizonae]|uniref:Regulatory protein n=1 Tax=Salmonella enterica subsp. arizonae TaxID=59203 RepID=A0A447R690_SALER|nr:regulatory protein [Salmonella enterica subsp. arizonae]
MELRHLRYFLAVAEEGHFGRAAERLNIVPPALSMQIKALEEELGGPLFMRTSRKVVLTEAGRLLQVEAQRTMDQAENARLAVQRSIRGESGRVRVGFAGNAVFSGKLDKDMRAFRKAYPDAELVAREVAPLLQADAILSGQLDIGYTPDHSLLHVPGLLSETVGVWNRLVAIADDHPLAKQPYLTVDMLADEPIIFYDTHSADEPLLHGAHPNTGPRAPDCASYLQHPERSHPGGGRARAGAGAGAAAEYFYTGAGVPSAGCSGTVALI